MERVSQQDETDYDLFPRRGKPPGLPPGTPVHIGRRRTERVVITQIEYDVETFEEATVADPATLVEARHSTPITWVNVAGLHDIPLMEAIGRAFEIHPLLLEDIVNTSQRPKIELFDHYVYLIFKSFRWNQETAEVETEQISIVLGDRFVLSFQEQEQDPFAAVRARLRGSEGRIRTAGADYLAYRLLDVVVDNYFAILEQLGEAIEDLEEELVDRPNRDLLQRVYHLKRELLFLRRSVWPLREVIGQLHRGELSVVAPETRIYLRDVYEHTITVMDTIETYRDIVAGLLDIYLSSISNKTNDVMKVLTVISTIFIPLTFVTGLYGMNFHYMPELSWPWGYPMVWLVILSVSGSMLLYFRRRGWV